MGKWPRVRQRETTVRIHADATTTTTHFSINTRWATMAMSDIFRLTGHYTNVAVAVGKKVIEGRLL